MRNRIAAGLAALTAGLVLTFGAAAPALAQKDKDKGKEPKGAETKPAPKFLYGHDLRLRPGGETDWVKAVKVGVEVYLDETTNTMVAISEAGSLTVAPGNSVGQEKSAKWLTAHDLSVRKAGEPEFTQKTKKYGVEVFRDLGSNRLLYGCETASIAFAPVPAGLVNDKGPKWHHAMEPKVRAPDQLSFDNAKKFGMEVFKDENTGTPGTLIYVTETGGIATAPAPTVAPDKNKIAPPKTAYGLILSVRGADETEFIKGKTKQVSVEVFSDPNANDVLFYITDAGSVATAPNPGKFAEAKGVTWKHAMTLRARKGGETSFDKAKKFGVEVFQDNRTGHLIFISDTGAIAVLPKQ